MPFAACVNISSQFERVRVHLVFRTAAGEKRRAVTKYSDDHFRCGPVQLVGWVALLVPPSTFAEDSRAALRRVCGHRTSGMP